MAEASDRFTDFGFVLIPADATPAEIEKLRFPVVPAPKSLEKDIGDVDTTGPPPNLRWSTEGSPKNCAVCCLARHPLCVMYGNWRVHPDQVCDGWQKDPSTL